MWSSARAVLIRRVCPCPGGISAVQHLHNLIAEPVDPKVEEERLAYRRAYANLFEQAIRDGIAEGTIPEQNTRLAATCLVGAISEALVGPLSPTQTSELPDNDNNDNELVDTIVQRHLY